ncbi:hypothetical protein RI129_009394 [Pyrocoelia pectoralis]|uniref:Uncharacterized protein n=1 Tax=Pyrocoelia pectoralis TaxID=417401 RepID=A0AAN7ZEU9_9COLE
MEMALSGKINNTTNGRIGSPHTNGCKHIPVKSLPNLVELKTQNGNVKNGHHLQETIVESVMKLITAETKKESNHSLQSQWKTLEVTGEKNARLICIRDESLSNELPKNPPPSFVTLSPEETEVQVIPAENESNTIDKAAAEKMSERNIEDETVPERNCVVRTKKVKTSVKISRLPKLSLKKLTPLPKQKIKSILQGKLQHAKAMKIIPMYCKTSDQHPWEVLNKITDRLLQDILFVISKEIQVNNILQSLYNSEFL